MTDYEDSLFTNLPRRRLAGDERGADAFNRGFREVRGMYQPEGPLPLRPRPSGKGGPSINQGTKPVTHSVWSASDAAANSMTLTNGGLTVDLNSLPSTWKSIRGSISHTTGKYYVEFLNWPTNAASEIGFGFADAGFVAGSFLGSTPYSFGSFNFSDNDIGNPTANYTMHYFVTGIKAGANDVWALAVDFNTGNVWVAQNNVWFNSSNPGTGTAPLATFVAPSLGQAFFPALSGFQFSGVWTLQATPASQKYAPPAGFTPWG